MDYFQNLTWTEAWTDMLDVLIRSVVSILILFFLSKILGNKQISQLSFFDYAVGISIGSIAADMATNTDNPHHFYLIAMLVYILISALATLLSMKSMAMRRLINGTPITLIDDGKIIDKNLARAGITVNDLLSECRHCGFFDVSDVKYAVEETSGTISFLPKSIAKPLTPKDIGLIIPDETEYANVIIDGKIVEQNLQNAKKNRQWLESKLEKKGVDVKDLILATLDKQGNLKLYSKTQPSASLNVFD